MSETTQPGVHERWAHFRFAVVGELLAAPPARGDLHAELERLAERTWKRAPGERGADAVRLRHHRTAGTWRRAHARQDPVAALRRKMRKDAGRQRSMGVELRRALRAQYRAHPSWSAQLHYDNLVTLAESRRDLRPVPSYWTVLRYLRAHGLERRPRRGARNTAGAGARCGAPGGAGGAQLRSRIRRRSVALGLPSRLPSRW